jgi:N,N'-diacetyllegionaminate synthase
MKNQVYIIAEIGVNHEGDVDKCACMINAAADVGVDAVKLQTIDADSNYIVDTESYKIFKSSELSRDETASMFELAKRRSIDIFTTAGDIETINWVEKLKPSAWKISSGLLTHIPLIQYLASLNRPLLISTGMGSVEEIDLAIETTKNARNDNVKLFQCTSLYPALADNLNLAAIRWLKNRYGYDVGYSDHSIGTDAAFLAVGAGATLIEKHFSFDTNRPGFDHGISLNHDGLKEMVERIRLAERMLGAAEKNIPIAVMENRKKYLRSLVATSNINIGDIFTVNNINVKRTLSEKRGCEPKYLNDFLGKIACRDIRINEPVNIEDIK